MISQRGKANSASAKANPARGKSADSGRVAMRGVERAVARPVSKVASKIAAKSPAKPDSKGEAKAAAKESTEERQVLDAFRKFLMAPGEMLCFAGNEVVMMRSALQRLTSRGLLVAEKFPGAYSLTSAGFALMQAKE